MDIMERRRNSIQNPQVEAGAFFPAEGTYSETSEQAEDVWGTLNSVGRKIKNKEWYKQLFKGKSKEELEKEKVSPDLVARLVRNLEQGRYIGPLETQPISWSDTKIYREYVQNFFDSMRGIVGRPTLDGVNFLHRTLKDGNREFVEFTITSPAEYDHRYLLHHGGTTKFGDDRVAGEFGEGVKIASFLLLKKGVTNQVELGSDNWRAYYYLDELPEEEYPERVRGLYLRAEFVENGIKGNFLRFRVDKKAADSVKDHLGKMKNFFWHEGHPDFHNPTYANDFGGFKILPRGGKGNLYVAGQRYEYGEPEAWDNHVPGAHVWTFQKVLEKTRDRNYAAPHEVDLRIIKPLVESMDKDELLNVFLALEDYWLAAERDSTYSIPPQILSWVIDRLAPKLSKEEKQKVKELLPENLFAAGGRQDEEYEKMLESIGFRKGIYELQRFGVPTAREKIQALVETAKEPELESWEKRRVEILNQATQTVIKSAASGLIQKYMEFLTSPIQKAEDDLSFFSDSYSRLSAGWVISQLAHGKTPQIAIRETGSLKLKGGKGEIELHGFTKLFPDNIFLQKKLLRGDFLGALFAWAHEFAHNISGEDDYTAGFTDAERYLHELILITSFNSDELKKLQAEWNNIEVKKLNAKGQELEDE